MRCVASPCWRPEGDKQHGPTVDQHKGLVAERSVLCLQLDGQASSSIAGTASFASSRSVAAELHSADAPRIILELRAAATPIEPAEPAVLQLCLNTQHAAVAASSQFASEANKRRGDGRPWLRLTPVSANTSARIAWAASDLEVFGRLLVSLAAADEQFTAALAEVALSVAAPAGLAGESALTSKTYSPKSRQHVPGGAGLRISSCYVRDPEDGTLRPSLMLELENVNLRQPPSEPGMACSATPQPSVPATVARRMVSFTAGSQSLLQQELVPGGGRVPSVTRVDRRYELQNKRNLLRASAMISAVPCIATLLELSPLAATDTGDALYVLDPDVNLTEGSLAQQAPTGKVLMQNELSLAYWGKMTSKGSTASTELLSKLFEREPDGVQSLLEHMLELRSQDHSTSSNMLAGRPGPWKKVVQVPVSCVLGRSSKRSQLSAIGARATGTSGKRYQSLSLYSDQDVSVYTSATTTRDSVQPDYASPPRSFGTQRPAPLHLPSDKSSSAAGLLSLPSLDGGRLHMQLLSQSNYRISETNSSARLPRQSLLGSEEQQQQLRSAGISVHPSSRVLSMLSRLDPSSQSHDDNTRMLSKQALQVTPRSQSTTTRLPPGQYRQGLMRRPDNHGGLKSTGLHGTTSPRVTSSNSITGDGSYLTPSSAFTQVNTWSRHLTDAHVQPGMPAAAAKPAITSVQLASTVSSSPCGRAAAAADVGHSYGCSQGAQDVSLTMPLPSADSFSNLFRRSAPEVFAKGQANVVSTAPQVQLVVLEPDQLQGQEQVQLQNGVGCSGRDSDGGAGMGDLISKQERDGRQGGGQRQQQQRQEQVQGTGPPLPPPLQPPLPPPPQQQRLQQLRPAPLSSLSRASSLDPPLSPPLQTQRQPQVQSPLSAPQHPPPPRQLSQQSQQSQSPQVQQQVQQPPQQQQPQPQRPPRSRCNVTECQIDEDSSSSESGSNDGSEVALEEELRDSEGEDLRWHEVQAVIVRDPVTGKEALLLLQTDITVRALMEKRMSTLTETQLTMLENMYPRQVLEFAMSGSGANTNLGSLAYEHEDVSVLFMDICEFTSMSKEVQPQQVMQFLNDMFSKLDDLCDFYNVYKVDTAGDCYIVAGALMKMDDDGFIAFDEDADVRQGARNVVEFAQAIMRHARIVHMPHNGIPASVRVGVHTGSVVSGLVGTKLLKFSLFGDTMNTSSRMESTSKPGCIQISSATYEILDDDQKILFKPTGGVQVKGKGLMATYINEPRAEDLELRPEDLGVIEEEDERGSCLVQQTEQHGTNQQHSVMYWPTTAADEGKETSGTLSSQQMLPLTDGGSLLASGEAQSWVAAGDAASRGAGGEGTSGHLAITPSVFALARRERLEDGHDAGSASGLLPDVKGGGEGAGQPVVQTPSSSLPPWPGGKRITMHGSLGGTNAGLGAGERRTPRPGDERSSRLSQHSVTYSGSMLQTNIGDQSRLSQTLMQVQRGSPDSVVSSSGQDEPQCLSHVRRKTAAGVAATEEAGEAPDMLNSRQAQWQRRARRNSATDYASMLAATLGAPLLGQSPLVRPSGNGVSASGRGHHGGTGVAKDGATSPVLGVSPARPCTDLFMAAAAVMSEASSLQQDSALNKLRKLRPNSVATQNGLHCVSGTGRPSPPSLRVLKTQNSPGPVPSSAQ